MYRILFLFCSLLILGCNTDFEKDAVYFSAHCNNADSILDFYAKNHNNEKLDRRFLAITYNRIQLNSRTAESQKFLDAWEKKLSILPNVANFYYQTVRCRQMIPTDKDSAQYLINQMLLVPGLIQLDSMSVFELKSIKYYYEGKIDSALVYMKKGYEISLKQGYKKVIGSFATSLGGLYSLSGQSKSATEYLLRALSYDSTNTVLINNLASVLILENRYEEAEALFKKYPEKLEKSNNDASSLNYKLTYIHLNQKLNNWDVSRNWLRSIGTKEIPEVQRVNYELFELEQLNHDKPDLIRGYLNDVIKSKGWAFYNTLFYTLSDVIGTQDYAILAEHFERNIEQLDTNNFDDLCFAAYYQLLGDKNSKNGNYRLASDYFRRAKNRFIAYAKESDKAEKSDLFSQLELIRMEQRREEAHRNAEIAQLELRRNKIITYFSVSILIGGLFVGIRWKRLTDKNLRLSTDLIEQKRNELEILEREKETSKKLIELSARVLEKSKDLKQTINNFPDKSNPEIRKSLEDLDYILMLNKSVDTTVITRGYNFDDFSYLEEITDSQRNVLSLTLDGYRPKEIAVTLNLSYSYVRNVQSKLRKILKNQGFDDFEDFKNEINP